MFENKTTCWNKSLKDSINMLTVGDVKSNIPYKPIGRYVCASSFLIIQFIYTGNTQCHSLMNV